MKIHDATEQAYKNGYEQGKKDALASDQVIVLPCKVGDTIYRITSAERKEWIWEWEIVVAEIYVDGVMFVDDSDNRFDEEDIGKTVFLTREEAEAALRKEDEGK